ncbi:general substrate transporter [Rickenella mellea]|uniref:General substrate transporter n=1 Tax=Rickenella mellea TaxID=50990 RepID=A0A4Y7QDW1_9AGAM|nr:general substrate transporter [Rickenella mellea]
MAPRTVPEWTIVDFIHRGPWWRNHGILILNLCLILPLMTSAINGFDSSLVNGLQIVPDWQKYFNYPEGKALGLINSAQNVGAIIGMPFTPLASDRLGRRAALFIGSFIMLGGVALQVAAQNVAMFIGARFIIGFGLSFATNAAPLLITELAYPTQRGKLTSLYNSSWYSGSIIAAWACFAAFKRKDGSTWSWKIPSLIQAAGSVLQVCLVWWIPESPRWLISKGLEGQAAKVLARYHANGNDERDPLVVFEMAQIRHALKLEKEYASESNYLSLFATPGNRRRMRIIIAIAIFSQWSGNGLVSFYINLVLEGVGINNAGTKAEINGGLQIWNFFCAITAALLVDKLGRRTLFLASNTGMLIAFSLWTLTTALFRTTGNTDAAKVTILFIFLFFFFYDIAYTPMLVAYTLEILPFSIRAKGFAVMNITVCLTLAFNQFVNPWALDAMGWKYYLVYCGWLVFELAFVLRYIIETKGRTLEETAALFDGDQAPKDLAAMGGEAATTTMTRAVGPEESWVDRRGNWADHRREKITTELYELRHSPQAHSIESGSSV